jgi:hypothetical protein
MKQKLKMKFSGAFENEASGNEFSPCLGASVAKM